MSETENIKYFICSGCKTKRESDEFEVYKGSRRKTCVHCQKKRRERVKSKKCKHGITPFRDCSPCRLEFNRAKAAKSKCEHGRIKYRCKECKGNSICSHGRIKGVCKECGGSQLCLHEKVKSTCRICEGSAFCIHDKYKNSCRECGGGRFCEHNNIKYTCKECSGSQICEHKRRKYICKECNGGSICEHNKIIWVCKKCKGGSICEHDKIKTTCSICDPTGHLSNIVRQRVIRSLDSNKTMSSKEYLGCTIDEYKAHIESQFKDGMTWENYGEWEIDHTVPIKFDEPTIEEVIERLHYSNTAPMWKEDNATKGNRYITI